VDTLDQKTVEVIGVKAKELNKELETTVQRLYQMREIDYEKNKIEFLYWAAEQSLAQMQHVEIVVRRLAALEKIHQASPDLALQFQNVTANAPKLNEKLGEEAKGIEQIKELMLNSVKEIQ
jgi:hypothetical protein